MVLLMEMVYMSVGLHYYSTMHADSLKCTHPVDPQAQVQCKELLEFLEEFHPQGTASESLMLQ